MKILQINAVHKKLSTGRNMAELNHFFREAGHDTVAAFSVGEAAIENGEYLIGNATGQKVHALLSRLTGLQGYYSFGATKKLLQFMDNYQPNVVLLNNLHANYIHLPMLLKYLAQKDIPTVVVLHDCWFYTGKCCYYTVQGCDKWKTKCNACPAKKQYNKSWFFDWSRKMLQDKKKYFGAIPRLGVVAVSDWLLNETKQSPVFANASIMTRIYNWIDIKQFAPTDTADIRKKMGLTDKKVFLGVAAGWDTRKGIDTFQWIAQQLNDNEQLVLVGKLPESESLPANVIHIQGTSSCEDLAAYYSMADVFIQPSLEETFGKVTAEALACGTPVVCYRSTATPELVGPGCGAVVEPGNREMLLKKAREILKNGKSAYSEACCSFAKENFDITQNCQQYLDVCSQMVLTKEETGL